MTTYVREEQRMYTRKQNGREEKTQKAIRCVIKEKEKTRGIRNPGVKRKIWICMFVVNKGGCDSF